MPMTPQQHHPQNIPGMRSQQNLAGRQGGIKQQTTSQKGGVRGRSEHGGIIASGTPIRNPGRIAGGAPGIPNPRLQQVHAPIVYRSPTGGGSRPGGLIDRVQQINPRATTFVHPFSGGHYLSVPSQMFMPATTSWNGFLVMQHETPSLQPHERGTFFRKSITPPVKTQFGAQSQAGSPSARTDTAFNRNPLMRLARPQVQSVTPTEKVVNQPGRKFPASFLSFNHLRADPVPQAAASFYGMGGRWGHLKRSANSIPVMWE